MAYTLILLVAFTICVCIGLGRRPENISTGRVFSLNYTNCLRGIAIILIIVGHISGTMGTVVFSPLGGTGVALFLFLSGFGLNESWKKSGLTRYWQKKIRRVFIPYFIVISIIAMVKDNMSWQNYLLDIFGIKTSYWYIGYLLKWYIVFWLSTKFAFKYRLMIMSACALVSLFYLPNLEAEQSLSFLMGVVTSVYVERVSKLTNKQIISLGIISFVIATLFLGIKQLPEIRMHINDWIYNIVQLFIKLPYALSVMSFVWLIPIIHKSRFLLFTGAISYELYLVHFPFYGMVNGSLTYAVILIIASYLVAKMFSLLNARISKFQLNRV